MGNEINQFIIEWHPSAFEVQCMQIVLVLGQMLLLATWLDGMFSKDSEYISGYKSGGKAGREAFKKALVANDMGRYELDPSTGEVKFRSKPEPLLGDFEHAMERVGL